MLLQVPTFIPNYSDCCSAVNQEQLNTCLICVIKPVATHGSVSVKYAIVQPKYVFVRSHLRVHALLAPFASDSNRVRAPLADQTTKKSDRGRRCTLILVAGTQPRHSPLPSATGARAYRRARAAGCLHRVRLQSCPRAAC
jgi:hypothetical protein